MRHLVNTKFVWLLILLGSLTWSLIMVKSGLVYSFGMGFWGPNGHDGIWHLALAGSLARGSFEMPTFAGEHLQNYHVGFDLLLALIHKVTHIPTTVLYFQIFPPIAAFLIGWLTYKFVLLWRGSKLEAFWATFFVYFGGSWGWVLTLIRDGKFGGESIFWSQQAVSTLINPPFALSLIFVLLGLNFLLQSNEVPKKPLLAIFCFVLLSQIKIYGAVLSLGALGLVAMLRLLKRKNPKFLLVFFVSVTVSIFLYLQLNKVSTSLLVFQPFWFLENMMALSDRVGWQKFYEALLAYKSGGILYKAIPAYIVAFLIFWFGNMGTRAIKEIWMVRKLRDVSGIGWVDIFVAVVILAGGIIPMFFLQKGTPWNTIQFFYYSLFFSGILAGVSLVSLVERSSKTKVRLLVGAVLILTLPTTLSTLLNDYLPGRPPAKISNAELEALDFLKHQPLGAVLTYPYDSQKAEKVKANPPRPLYLYESTAYVSAFADKPVYLEDQVNLDITGFNWPERREKVEHFLASLDRDEVYSFLRNNNIKYIYWLKGQRATLGEAQLGISRLFENKEVDIYKVD